MGLSGFFCNDRLSYYMIEVRNGTFYLKAMDRDKYVLKMDSEKKHIFYVVNEEYHFVQHVKVCAPNCAFNRSQDQMYRGMYKSDKIH